MGKIEIFYEEINSLSLQKNTVKRYIKYLVSNELKGLGDISFIFCTDDYLLKINQQYLEHDYYTDIITFDYVENEIISGDLFISLERVKENALTYNTDFKRELFRVIFHGILHLCGYKDKTDLEKRIMREKEEFYLSEVDFRGIEL